MPFSSMKRTTTWLGALGLRGLVGALCVLVLVSCAKKQPTDDVTALQTSLTFLEDGKTTKEGLRGRLGPPSGEFNQGEIWTYSGLGIAYHLVVVFGDQDIVKTHRIVKVK